MRKNEKYYAVNNQEDEDGYNIYPAKTNFYGNSKSKQHINSSDKKGNTEPGAVNMQMRSIILSQPMIHN